jgi:hypothetical protein
MNEEIKKSVKDIFDLRHHIESNYGYDAYTIESVNQDFIRFIRLTDDEEYLQRIVGVKLECCQISSGYYRNRQDENHWNMDGSVMVTAVSAIRKIDEKNIQNHYSGFPCPFPTSPNHIELTEFGENVWLIPKTNPDIKPTE